MRVPIDYRAALDVDGDATDIYLDVGEFLVGISVLIGSGWIIEQRRARAEWIAEMDECLARQ